MPRPQMEARPGVRGRPGRKRRIVVFVEVFRLLLVVAGVIGGLQLGDSIGRDTLAPLVAVSLCVLGTYLLGGLVGRVVDRSMQGAVTRLRDMPPAEIFAASVVGTTGLLLGLAAGMAVLPAVHARVGYPLAAALAWVLCAGGARLGIAKGKEVVRAVGMAHLLERPGIVPAAALVVDTSALLDRQLLVLGRAGLLTGGLVVPRVVLDEARALASGPDQVSARRARAGVEGLEALRHNGIVVRVEEGEVPEEQDVGDKALVVARRLHLRVLTCSAEIVARAEGSGVPAIDLRRLAAELGPAHPVGERLAVDLLKAGRQPGQAVGYLPDGDMVVVNDAAALVGQRQVPVVVAATRQTSQGLLVFAEVAGSAATRL